VKMGKQVEKPRGMGGHGKSCQIVHNLLLASPVQISSIFILDGALFSPSNVGNCASQGWRFSPKTLGYFRAKQQADNCKHFQLS